MPQASAQPQPEYGWCPTCKRRREIADRFSDYVQERNGQRGVFVTQFYCGHSDARDDGWFAPFP